MIPSLGPHVYLENGVHLKLMCKKKKKDFFFLSGVTFSCLAWPMSAFNWILEFVLWSCDSSCIIFSVLCNQEEFHSVFLQAVGLIKPQNLSLPQRVLFSL